MPKRANGMEKVVMFGVMSRITITSDGLEGVLADMLAVLSLLGEVCNLTATFCAIGCV